MLLHLASSLATMVRQVSRQLAGRQTKIRVQILYLTACKCFCVVFDVRWTNIIP